MKPATWIRNCPRWEADTLTSKRAVVTPLQLLVTDAGPLIALAVAGVLPAAARHYRLLVPQAVLDECLADVYAPGAAQVSALAAGAAGAGSARLRRVAMEDILPLDAAFAAGLGTGEVAVLSYAAHHQYVALVDERRARRVAQRLNVRVVGSGTVLLALKSHGLVPSIRPALAAWAAHGYFVSPRLIEQLLTRAGET